MVIELKQTASSGTRKLNVQFIRNTCSHASQLIFVPKTPQIQQLTIIGLFLFLKSLLL